MVSEFNSISIDTSIRSEKLDLPEGQGKSLFRWSGQFPPELIEVLLEKYAHPGITVLDPFCGSGSVLFESAKRHLKCIGSDINPAAVELSKTVSFCNISKKNRQAAFGAAYKTLQSSMGVGLPELSSRKLSGSDYESLKDAIKRSASEPLARNILLNVLMRFSISKGASTVSDMEKAFEAHKKIIIGLPLVKTGCEVFLSDARRLPLRPESVDIVLTSPPYPGVFDYYKNYKWAAHIAGWKISDVARHEIGRGKGGTDKLSWVMRYSTDMLSALLEIRRVIRYDGRLILVAGRDIQLGMSTFEASALLYILAVRQCGFRLAARQQRHFTGRSGSTVTEDILHLLPAKDVQDSTKRLATEAAEYLYKRGSKGSGKVQNKDSA